MHLNGGKMVKCYLMGKTYWEYANGQKINVNGKFWPLGGCLPLPRGYIHVYFHNNETSSPLKPLGQSKPNFIWSILGKGERKFI